MRVVPTRPERQARTRTELIDAAGRLFASQGFHATSVDAVAAEAGYTKGAVYSNFESKEDLFFATYERRLEERRRQFEAILEAAPTASEGLAEAARTAAARAEGGDGWLAVFFEFWAHVLRHPDLLSRFAKLHKRIVDPLEAGLIRLAQERGQELPEDPRKLATARYAMELGLQLERLTQPDVVDMELGARMITLSLAEGGLDGISDQAPAGRRTRRPRKPRAARA
jgi:AcrR family transcriptional regulator